MYWKQISLFILFIVNAISSSYSQNLEFEELKDIPGAYITSINELSTGEIIISTPQGIWKGSSDFSSWIKISSGIVDSTVLSIVITKSDFIIAGTPTGLYRTTTLGTIWTKVGGNFSSNDVRHLSIHPNGYIYAGVHKRLYRSRDNGVTWLPFADNIMKLYVGEACYGAAHYGKDNRLFVMTHYSDDDGKTWKVPERVGALVPNETYSNGIVHAYATMPNGFHYISYTDTTRDIISGYFLVSTDNGINWGAGNHREGREKDYSKDDTKEVYHNFLYLRGKQKAVNILPHNGDTALFFPYHGFPILAKPVITLLPNYIFVDLRYFSTKQTGLTSTEVTCTKVLSNGTFILGTYGAGLFYSTNRGLKWNKVILPINYPVLTCYARSDKLGKTYLGTTDGLYEYDEKKNVFNEIPLTDTNGKCILSIALRPKDAKLFFIGREGLYEREGSTFKKIYPSYLWNFCKDLLFYDDTLNLATEYGGLYSHNYQTWLPYEPISPKGFAHGFFNYFNKKYSFPITIESYLTTLSNKISIRYYSPIYGTVSLMAGIPYYRLVSLEPLERRYPNSFAITEGSSNDDFYLGNETGVYKLDVEAKAWVQNKKTGLLTDRVLALASNQVGEVFAGALTGAFFSIDKTTTWSKIAPFPTTAVRSLAVDHKGYIYAGLAWGGIYKSTQSSVKMSAPELAVPANNAKEIKVQSNASWKQVRYATGYHLQLSKDSLFTSMVSNDSTLDNSVLKMEKLLEINSQYYWRVRGVFDRFRGEWSEIRTFTTETIVPEKPALSKPKKKSVNIVLNPLLQWTKSIYSDHHHTQLSTKEDFSAVLIDDSTVYSSARLVDNLQSGTEYFWRIRGKNKAGYGPWSEVWNFTTENVNSVNEEKEELLITINATTLIIENNPNTHTRCIIYITNIKGERLLSSTIEKGIKSTQIQVESLPEGYYMVSLECETGVIHKNLLYSK